MNALEQEIKNLIIEALNLEDMSPEDISSDILLFGEGLGLDSIDALELVVGIERLYGIRIADAEVGKKAFASVNALAEFVREKRAAL